MVGVTPTYLSSGNGELLLTLLTVCCFIIFQPCVALRKKKHLRTSPHVSSWLAASCDCLLFLGGLVASPDIGLED